jgi:uncharacterized protein involved in exopolysaccharide biosynthesis
MATECMRRRWRHVWTLSNAKTRNQLNSGPLNHNRQTTRSNRNDQQIMIDTHSEPHVRVPTLRDLVVPIFRHKRAGMLVALTVFAVTAVVVLTRPKQYEAEMKILVKRERIEPVVSADPDVRAPARMDVTEDQLNSEVELLKSRDLLEAVATAAGLYSSASGADARRNSLPRVVQQLQSNLKISPIRRTTFIRVTYRASDPVLAAWVLTELARLYPEKHVALHRPPGAYEFFTAQAEQFRKELDDAEGRLKEFGRQQHVVSADVERQNTLQRLADFEAALQQAQGSIADATRRITELESEAASTPARQTTQIRTSENRELIGQLKARILDLEVKHADMLRKFVPSYPPALEVEQELNQARAALARAEEAPFTEQTTDQNPTHQWLQGELARVKTERAAAIARAAALTNSIGIYRERARQLDEKAVTQQNLTRAMKAAEENYLLYRRKQEEARISDALDQTRIVNVAVAEAPTIPSVPANIAATWLLLLGTLMALVLGTCVTYLLDYLSPYFRTPDEVESTLDVPVLATIPASR